MTDKAFLKWAGGKRKLLPTILPLLTGNKLIEPFSGSGVVFLNATQTDIHVNDINLDLINVFNQIKLDYLAVLLEVKLLFKLNSAADYANLRAEFNKTTAQNVRKAALFIYLNRHGFNGLCRYNKSGGFNVPYGKYSNPYLPEDEIKAAAAKMNNSNIVLTSQDFITTMTSASPGDIIYCDPPYVPVNDTSFTSYSASGFSEQQHKDLALMAENLAKAGVKIVISNADTPFTRSIYSNASSIQTLQVNRSISANSASRTKASEILVGYS